MTNSYQPPKQRVAADAIDKQSGEVQQARSAGLIQHGRDELVMVTNQGRQIVYASPKLIEIFGDEPFHGKRPGEVLRCVHAGKENCGLTDFCKFCGAARAFADAQTTSGEIEGECVVQTKVNGLSVTYNFDIRTVPLEIQSRRYLVVLLKDVSEKKHKAALERIFFHDVLNTATGLNAYLDLLKRQVTSKPDHELVVRISEITDTLIEEIQSQKLLLSAENGTLNLSRQIIISHELVQAVVAQYEQLECASNKTIKLAPFCESFSFISDDAVLRRVLGNMVKNALEATKTGETVTVRFGVRDKSVVFEVHNPGVIPYEVQPRIFSRFFSTKGDGHGLGTYSIKLLTENYLKGQVSFASDNEKGTVFSVSVPIKDIS